MENVSAPETIDAGRVAVITGGASGIGQALAVEYARVGMTSVVGYFAGDPHDPNETAEAVRQLGGECVMVESDVRSTESSDALVETAMSRFGRIDAVVANAGILSHARIEEMADNTWDNILAVDLTGVMKIFRAAVPHLLAGSALVAVSSMSGGVYGWKNHSHYAAAKAGILGLVRSLADELGSRDIRANTVVPGLVATPQSLAPTNLGPEGLAAAAKGVPLERAAQPYEVAKLIRFLTSADSSYITGAEIRIDGGLTIRQAT